MVRVLWFLCVIVRACWFGLNACVSFVCGLLCDVIWCAIYRLVLYVYVLFVCVCVCVSV